MQGDIELYTEKLYSLIRGDKRLIRKRLEIYLADANTNKRKEKIIKELCDVNVNKVCDNTTEEYNRIILVCIVKNEFGRVNRFIDYYRKIGVSSFVFMDNNSDDGTKEYLSRQQGVILYCSSDEYSSERRVAWINYLLLLHGEKKWCVVVDSDEYLSYIGCEIYSLERVIESAIKKGLKRVGGFLLDMYPKGKLFCNNQTESFLERCSYFDYTGYEKKRWKHGFAIKGGPRRRVFDCDVLLSKYPLFYFENEVFYANSRYLFPDDLKKDYPIWFAIRHYKFLDEKDFEKIKDAVTKENYFRSSEEYKIYFYSIRKDGYPEFFNFRYSIEYDASSSLSMIEFMENPFE